MAVSSSSSRGLNLMSTAKGFTSFFEFRTKTCQAPLITNAQNTAGNCMANLGWGRSQPCLRLHMSKTSRNGPAMQPSSDVGASSKFLAH